MNKKRFVWSFITLGFMVLMLLVAKPINSFANESVSKAMEDKINKNVVEFISTEKTFFDRSGVSAGALSH